MRSLLFSLVLLHAVEGIRTLMSTANSQSVMFMYYASRALISCSAVFGCWHKQPYNSMARASYLFFFFVHCTCIVLLS